jgi:hypothetical protein
MLAGLSAKLPYPLGEATEGNKPVPASPLKFHELNCSARFE